MSADEAPDELEGDAETEIAGGDARTNQKREGAKGRPRSRSAGHIRSGARLLSKEAQKILRRHRANIAEDVAVQIEQTVEQIDALRARRSKAELGELEWLAEELDELLHKHASFGRKSTLRDTLENIGIAVGVALAVRSCVYEPFKIPSGSMMPTLRAGDHIFVNKFAYGVQIPLTTTVIGEDWISPIARGDVIVFRYPLNERDDFIKRVIGLPGDSLRVNQDRRSMEIKRAGDEEFEKIEREAMEERCLAENSGDAIENCTVFKETLDEHTYFVRYRDDLRSADSSKRTFIVPDGFLLVMGDNRNASHDSLAWTVTADGVSAASLITRGDIRDLTPHKKSRMELRDEGVVIRANDDATRDRARYLAERRAPDRDLALELWRSPPTDADATFESLALHYAAHEHVDLAQLAGAKRPADPARVESMGELRYGSDDNSSDLLFRSNDRQVLFRLHCGKKRCPNKVAMASSAVDIMEAFEADPDADARSLMPSERGRAVSYPGRGKVDERFVERRFGALGKGVRIRAWRSPREGLEAIRDAALGEFGVGPVGAALHLADATGPEPAQAAAATDLGPDSWIVSLENGGWAVVDTNHNQNIVAVLECGPKRCESEQDILSLATVVTSRYLLIAEDAGRLPQILGQSDVGGGFAEVPVDLLDGSSDYYWDRLAFEGAILDDGHALDIQVEMDPDEGLAAAVEARRAKLEQMGDTEAVEGLGPAACYANTPNGHTFVFTVSETNLVVQISCRSGMCPERDIARKLAERAREKGRDPENFVQKDLSRPRPFVPRGNVKGRAEVIWWPTPRFWKKID